MKKSDIIAFFDSRAQFWDAEMIKSDEIIETILDNVKASAGMNVLDVACGTGVMFPYYLKRNAASITGIDISPKMAEIAAEKFACEEKIRVICGDVEETEFSQKFDLIMVYNAFPHFPDPERLISTLSKLLNEGGRLCIAHGASRETIDSHHKGPAGKVSVGLMEAKELKLLMAKYLNVDTMISNDYMYQVSGAKR
ncbi:MAG: class I SAM-dependent methyltransferase [Oscillospiraceae bacterium]|nr:class I SAM-dependent methyltransferase [Oscillospiraceae bacterium]